MGDIVIDYVIKKDDNKLYIAENNIYLVVDSTIQKYINNLLLKRLNNLSALEKSTRKLFGFKNKIPLFISHETLLLCIMSYRMNISVYLNFFAISKYEEIDGKLIVHFYSGHCYYCESSHAFYSQIKKAQKMMELLL